MKLKNQRGFHLIGVLLAVVLLGVIGFTGWKVFSAKKDKGNQNTPAQTVNKPSDKTADPNAPPLKLKSIGINLGIYDPATGKAGDVMFTKDKTMFDLIYTDYGYVISSANSSTGQDKASPQPTFLLPMGTKVQALVDGVVVGVPKLYSNDYSVQVATNSSSQWRYETEHVINPLVKEGDKVKAGQVIAEVSPHNQQNDAGLGMVEIGILRGGNPPQHFCPFANLDDSIKADVQKKLTELYKAWEDYRGDTNLYDEAGLKIPGCLTLDPIEG